MAENLNANAQAPKRVVVIGSGGFVGSTIVETAAARGYNVLGIGSADADLMTEAGAKRLQEMLDPGDAVVFVSAKAPCKDYSMFLDNIVLAKNGLDALTAQSLDYVLYISSDAVYSDSDAPLTESSPMSPDNLHGQMHVSRELMFSVSLGDAPYGALRPTLIYGAADPHNGYGPNKYRRHVQNDEPIPLFGNGEERRDHVSVLDVAELAVRMIEHKTTGAVNAVTGSVASFMDIAKMTIGFEDKDIPIERLPRSGPMPHNGYRPFDASEVARLFPDFEFTALEDGLRDAYDNSRA